MNRHIHRLKEQGKAIVYISHRMEEIFEICDVVTVLKDGRNVGSRPITELTPQTLIAMLVGRSLGDLFPARSTSTFEQVLRVEGLRLDESSQPVDLIHHRGEIVALRASRLLVCKGAP